MKQITRNLIAAIFVFLSLSVSSFAEHIIGRDITVQCLSPNNCSVTVIFIRDYSDSSGAGFDSPKYLGVYDKYTNTPIQAPLNPEAPTISILPEGDTCFVQPIVLKKRL